MTLQKKRKKSRFLDFQKNVKNVFSNYAVIFAIAQISCYTEHRLQNITKRVHDVLKLSVS